MSTSVMFNLEIKKYLTSNNCEISKFISEKFEKSKYLNYYSFLDDFLFNYGIISFYSIPLINGNKYIPYINCKEKNIFSESKGITYLSEKPQNLKTCNKILAKYIISKFNGLELKSLIEQN